MRNASILRDTKETQISIKLNLDGEGQSNIQTGIGFLDHMLTLFSFHSGFDLDLKCNGDLEVDDHHTAEDIGIAIGQALLSALGDKKGISRYGTSYVPMDETLARVVVDLSGRHYLHYDGKLEHDRLGTLDTQNVKEFFRAFSYEARMNLHMEVFYGDNDHHKAEALFKATGRALRDAVTVVSNKLPSTKGVL
ncbi:MAG: hisB [Bacillales bacterium]|jgi:imidazoleglycerol-phosphate dehydratase|nr:hisB [Bacillales bacterium]